VRTAALQSRATSDATTRRIEMSIAGALSVIAAVAACPSSPGATSPGELHRQWILEGWERREGDGRFVFADKLGRFYSQESDLHLYDDYDPQHRVAQTAAEYGNFWEGPFNNFKSARHAVTDGPDVLIGGELATTTLEFVARLELSDGKVNSIRARSSLVWRCEDGSWRIVREQNSVRDVPPDEVQTVLEKE
jgi:ketosteroid isomerase-like protein